MQKNYLFKVVFTMILCGMFSISYAADWYISSTGNDTSGDGSLSLPWASFTKAQTMAAAGDIIHVSGMIDFSLEPGLVQPLGVAVAKNISIQGTSNATDGFDGKSLTRFLSNTTFSLTLKNLKLINGYSGVNNGGAIINTSTGSVNFENLIFESNKTAMAASTKTGAAIQIDNVNGAVIKNCVFLNNEASKTGAIYITAWAANSTILFENCAFSGNVAKESFGGSALFIRSNTSANTTCNIINCTFKGNQVNTAASGGTIYVAKSPNTTNVNIINCTVSENTTAGTASHTAGIHFATNDAAADANVYVKNCIVEGNTASGGVPADLSIGAAGGSSAGGTVGYIAIQNSIIGYVANSANIPAGNITASAYYNYLTTTSTTNDLKAGLAPFNTTTNTYPLYSTSGAIGYGSSAALTPFSTTDQSGNVRAVGATNYAGAWESTPLTTTTPNAPTMLVATAGDGQISLAFKSAATGGSNVTNYMYSLNEGAYITPDPAVTTSPIVITGLSNNTAYSVRLKAVNANGVSPESVASNVVTPTTTTGLKNTLKNSISISKNAINQIVIVNSTQKAGMISIYNAVGQQVEKLALNGSSSVTDKSFKSGVYLVIVKVDGNTTASKIAL